MVWLQKKELEMKLKLQQMISYSHLPGTVFYKRVPRICRLKFTCSLSIISICAEVQLKLYHLPVSLQTRMSLLFQNLLILTSIFRYVTGWFSPYHRKRKIIHPIIMHHFHPDAVR